MSKEKADQAETTPEERLAVVIETLETRKEELSNLQGEIKDMKEEHKIRSPKRITDKEIAKKYTGLIEEANVIKADIKALKAEQKDLTPKKEGGFGAKYDYPNMQVKDEQSGQMREMNKGEKKRWRTKARRVAAKDGTNPEAVEFDPNFMAPKPKKEKAKKEEAKPEAKADAKPEAKAEAKTTPKKKPIKKKKANIEESDD